MEASANKALEIWREKLERFQLALARATNEAVKIEYEGYIQEARERIAELEADGIGNSSDANILDEWMEQVADEHRRLTDHFERPTELQDIERAWVRLALAIPAPLSPGTEEQKLDNVERGRDAM